MKYCPTCGKVIPRGHGFKSDRRYCSYDCYRLKTPNMVKVEAEFEKPVRDVIVEFLNKNQNVTITADLIGISKTELHKWIKKMKIKKVLYWE
jgi:transcriptional regulator with PAS, ATPase and Fis domain